MFLVYISVLVNINLNSDCYKNNTFEQTVALLCSKAKLIVKVRICSKLLKFSETLPPSSFIFVNPSIFTLSANQIKYFRNTRCKHGLKIKEKGQTYKTESIQYSKNDVFIPERLSGEVPLFCYYLCLIHLHLTYCDRNKRSIRIAFIIIN